MAMLFGITVLIGAVITFGLLWAIAELLHIRAETDAMRQFKAASEHLRRTARK